MSSASARNNRGRLETGGALEVAAALRQARDVDAGPELHARALVAKLLPHGMAPLTGELRVERSGEGEGAGPSSGCAFALVAGPEALGAVVHAQGRDAQTIVASYLSGVSARS